MKIKFVKTILMPLLLMAILFALLQITAAGQPRGNGTAIGSLLYELQNSKPDTTRIKLLNKLARTYLIEAQISKTEFDDIFSYLQQAIRLCDSLHLNLSSWKYETVSLQGYVLLRCGRYTEGRQAFIDLIKTTADAGDKKWEALCWYKYAWALTALNINPPVADSAYKNAMFLYHELNDPHAEIQLGIEFAGLHINNNKIAETEQEYLNIIKTSEAAASYKLPDIYFALSRLNRYTGNFDKALRYALHAINSMELTNDSSNADSYYGELGEVYQALNKPAESAFWYKKCLLKRENMDYYQYGLYRTYNMLVTQLIKAGENQAALNTIKKLQKKNPPHSMVESAVLCQGLAYCYDALNLRDSSEKYFLAALNDYHKAGAEPEIISIAAIDIASFYVTHRQFKTAAAYLDEAVKYNASISASVRIQLLQFKVDSAFGNYQSAISHYQYYNLLHDSIFNQATSRQIEQLKIQYETAKKDKDIETLTKKDQLQQANLHQAAIIRNWIAASAALLILLLGVGYSRYRFKQKANKQLEEQQIVINQKNTALQHLVTEKEWLVKEIHHRVKNNFHIVIGLLGTQAGYLKNEEAIAAVKESQQRIHAMSLIHQKLYQSENLSAIDMPGYIHELVDYLKDSFNNSHSIQFHFQLHRIYLGLQRVIPVGLILNEAITNVIKYAFPNNRQGNIYISFTHSVEENIIILIVRDDGTGLAPGFKANRQPSMGITLMKGLSEDIDGSFNIESNNGTTVTVIFKYHPSASGELAPAIAGQTVIA